MFNGRAQREEFNALNLSSDFWKDHHPVKDEACFLHRSILVFFTMNRYVLKVMRHLILDWLVYYIICK